jgi:hypothetical protein
MKEAHAFQGNEFRRANERKRYNKEIIFTHSDGLYRGVIKNISVGGVHIESGSAIKFYKGDSVTVSIPYTSGNKNIKRKGRIVWVNDTGFAIEFFCCN